MQRDAAAWDRIAAEISDDEEAEDGAGANGTARGGAAAEGDVGARTAADADADAARERVRRRVGGAVGETVESSYGNGRATEDAADGGDLMLRDWYEARDDARVTDEPAPSVRVELGWPAGTSRGDFRYDSVSCKFTGDSVRLEVRDGGGGGGGADAARVFRFHRERLPGEIVPEKCSFRYGGPSRPGSAPERRRNARPPARVDSAPRNPMLRARDRYR